MDFNRQNTQTNPAAHAPIAAGSAPNVAAPRSGRKHGRKLNFHVGTGGGLLLIAAILVAFGLLWLFGAKSSNEYGQVNQNEYQAVFLSNGQVYFGKLVTLNNTYAKITHIFYLQVNQNVQSSSSKSQSPPTLVKLGNELHGPEDAMMINRSQILFWENLKPSGQVSEKIAQYYKNGGNSSTSTSTSTNPTPSTPSTGSTTPSTTTPTTGSTPAK